MTLYRFSGKNIRLHNTHSHGHTDTQTHIAWNMHTSKFTFTCATLGTTLDCMCPLEEMRKKKWNRWMFFTYRTHTHTHKQNGLLLKYAERRIRTICSNRFAYNGCYSNSYWWRRQRGKKLNKNICIAYAVETMSVDQCSHSLLGSLFIYSIISCTIFFRWSKHRSITLSPAHIDGRSQWVSCVLRTHTDTDTPIGTTRWNCLLGWC